MGHCDLEGQLNIFDFLANSSLIEEGITSTFGTVDNRCLIPMAVQRTTQKEGGKVLEKEQLIADYLKKDTVIRTLVRQRTHAKVFKKEDILDAISNTTYSHYLESCEGMFSVFTVAEQMTNNVVLWLKKKLPAAEAGNDRLFLEKIQEILAGCEPAIRDFKVIASTGEDHRDAVLVTKKSQSNTVNLSYPGKEDAILVFTPTSLPKRAKGGMYWIRRSGVKHKSKVFFDGFEILATMLVVNRCIVECNRLKELSEQEKKQDVLYNRVRNYLISHVTSEIGSNQVTVRKTLDFFSVPYIASAEKKVLGTSLCAFASVFNNVPIYDFVSSKYARVGLVQLFFLAMGEYRLEKSMAAYDKERGEYALSFMTKRAIPKSIALGMSTSKLNDYFGYVEFDETCELSSMTEIAREFEALSNVLFKGTRYASVSLRFRRLGNHKASGLFYPLHECICVDVGCPSSFVHEYFHMLDNAGEGTAEGLAYSRRYSFEPLYNMYCSLVKDATKGTKLKGKYDVNYYTLPTEVFARCAEIYVTKVLKIRNSLCAPVGGFAYPETDAFLEEVSIYFDAFLEELFEFNRKEYEADCLAAAL